MPFNYVIQSEMVPSLILKCKAIAIDLVSYKK